MESHQILVVDDDPITARFIASLLQEHGYDVLVAEDGAHALEIVERHELAMVVSDLVMPYRDGYSVLRAIRRNEKYRDLPVLLLSMRDREEDIVKGLEEGADDYVIKPFNARELMARIRKILRTRKVS
ncbi:MAG: response regulator [Acidobacteria bacterium]|nr:response regulator [Acidobacteriota bacterium]NIM63383.1 response regulator [Acidobacteriota bacterium]NIO60427.1 response regulator [Acidobacteriota bacterium]NIQ31522.1 response regulator [Acidobacteriota bacterium]NIQ86758.1 response regulator [Acidobacteriota bacterium]